MLCISNQIGLKFISYLRQVGGFSGYLGFLHQLICPSQILFKVMLNSQNPKPYTLEIVFQMTRIPLGSKIYALLTKCKHISVFIVYLFQPLVHGMTAELLNSSSWRHKVIACKILPTLYGTINKVSFLNNLKFFF